MTPLVYLLPYRCIMCTSAYIRVLSDYRMQQLNLHCKRSAVTCIALVIYMLSFLGVTKGQSAATLELVNRVNSKIKLDPYTLILIDKNKKYTNKELAAAGSLDFAPVNTFEFPPKYERGKYEYWLKTIVRNTTNEELHVGLDIGVFDSITTFVYQDRRLVTTIVYGNRTIDYDDDVLLSTTAPIRLASGRSYILLTKFKNQVDINRPLEPYLVNLDHHHKSVFYRLFTVYGIQIGLLSILFIVSLISIFQYVQSKERSYLFYGLYTVALLLFFSRDLYCTSPIIRIDFLPICSNTFVSPMVAGTFLLYILFISKFLEAKKNTPALYKIIQFSVIVCLLYIIIERTIYFFDSYLAWKFYGYFKALFLIIHIIIIIPLSRNPNRLTLYILMGSLVLILGTLTTAIMSFRPVHFVGYMDVTYIPQYIGIILELLLFSVGLGYKVKLNEYDLRKTKAEQLLKNKEIEHEREIKNVRRSFFSQVTHDFRSPIMMINDSATRIQNQDAIKNIIKKNTNNLLNLVDQSLEEIGTASQLVDSYIQNDIVAYIRYAMDSHEMSSLTSKRKIKFESNMPSYSLDFDPARLRRAFHNLLDNAIKYTDAGDKILVRLQIEEAKELWSLEIEDSGQGMSIEVKERIFEMYHQEADQQGYGRGLDVVKRYVQLMKGEIKVDSIKGLGSRFVIKLPIRKEARYQSWEVIPKVTQELMEEEGIESKELNDSLPTLVAILYQKDLVEEVHASLNDEFEILTISDDSEVFHSIENALPDLIISDIRSPESPEQEWLVKIKSHALFKHIPFILLVDEPYDDSIYDRLELQADAYIRKPFTIEELQLKSRNLIITQRNMREKYLAEVNAFDQTIDLDGGELQFLKEFNDIIELNIDERDIAAEAIKTLGTNTANLNKRIKVLTGLNTQAYVLKYKLNKARLLILEGGITTSEVAYAIGLSEHDDFPMLFRKEFGYFPLELDTPRPKTENS